MSVNASSGTVATDKIAKETEFRKKKPKQQKEEDKWVKHENFGSIFRNTVHHQLDELVKAGVKLDCRYATAKNEKNRSRSNLITCTWRRREQGLIDPTNLKKRSLCSFIKNAWARQKYVISPIMPISYYY